MKYFFSVLLAAMTIIAGFAGNIYKCDHWKAAVFSWCLCGLLFILAVIVGWHESLPKPHIVVVEYARLESGSGLIIRNDGDPAYNLVPPPPVPFGGDLGGDSKIIFEGLEIGRFTKEDGDKCLQMSVETPGFGSRSDNLATQLILRGLNNVGIRFSYADGRKPTTPRYTTLCELRHRKTFPGVSAVFLGCKFDWFFFLRGRK